MLELSLPKNKEYGHLKTFDDDFYYLSQSKDIKYPVYDYIFCDEV